jgi:HD-GYP domain-containing protein (c-di-GMP phosphodiesterase class II)
MRLLTTKSLSPGAVLGKTIYNERGTILVSEGATLTETIIKRLLSLNIQYVYIKDERTKGIVPVSSISDAVRVEAVQTIESTFAQIHINDKVQNAIVVEKAAIKFTQLIRSIMDQLKSSEDLLTLLADVYVYDNYIFSHSLNVALYSLALGMELKLNEKQLETLGMGAILHDVGKMVIPFEILGKAGKLTEEEYEVVKKHPEHGFKLLKDIHTVSLHVAHCAYQHHERLDGSGYPRGLVGNEIHDLGKIIAVADVFDAVTSNRVYRSAMLPHEGLEILYAGAGKQFEISIVEAFRKAVAIYPNGLSVVLNDGRKGVVSSQNVGIGDRPVIRIIEEVNQPLQEPYEVDLKSQPQLMIVKCMEA